MRRRPDGDPDRSGKSKAVLLDQSGALGYALPERFSLRAQTAHAPERDAYSDTILAGRLRDAMARLNPQIPEDARRTRCGG